MENGCFLSLLQALPRATKRMQMQIISIGTHAHDGFVRQIDSMDQRKYLQLDTTNKHHRASFQWLGQTVTEEYPERIVRIFTPLFVADAHSENECDLYARL